MTKSEAYSISLNGNYNDTFIEESMLDLKNSMFKPCSSYVKYLTGIKRFNGNMSDFEILRYFNTEHNLHGKTYTTSIEFDFVNFFRSYKFAKKNIYSLTPAIVNADREIYKYKALFFIDGYLMQEITLVPKGTFTVIAIEPYKDNNSLLTYDVITDLVNKNAKWTLILEPHSNFAYDTNIHCNVIFDGDDKIKIPMVDFNNIKKEKITNWKFFSSSNIYNNYFMTGALVNHVSNSMTISSLFTNYIRNNSNSSSRINYWLFNENNLYKRYYKSPNEVIDIILATSTSDDKLPIPENNVIVWKVDSNDCIRFVHDVTVEVTYPNIYKISINEDISGASKLLVDFYYDDTSELEFNNMLFDYIESIGSTEYLNKYLSDELPACIKDFVPKDYVYNITDFESIYTNHYYATSVYKVNKFKKFMNENVNVYREYCEKIEKYNFSKDIAKYYIDVSDSPWIYNRNVKGNTGQITNPRNRTAIFDEREYTFIIMTTDKLSIPQLAIFIDGIRVIDFKCFNESYKNYIYIPKEYINEDSMIELEMFNNFISDSFEAIAEEDKNALPLHFTNIGDTIRPIDIMVIDEESNFLDSSSYEITISEKELPKYKIKSITDTNDVYLELDENAVDEVEVSYDIDDEMVLIVDKNFIYVDDGNGSVIRYYKLSKNSPRPFDMEDISIIITDPSYYNKTLTIANANMTSLLSKKYSGFKYLDLELERFIGKCDINRFRFFLDGIKIPSSSERISVSLPNYYKGIMTTRFVLNPEKETSICMDYLPYSLKEIYTLNMLPENGVIKLKDHLNRPFDMAYYDVYLNGKKLTYKNVQVLSESVIRIRNCASRLNLRIYEKDFDDDIFDYENTFYHSIEEEIIYNEDAGIIPNTDFNDYKYDKSIEDSHDEGYIDDNGILVNIEDDYENVYDQDLDTDISEEIQKDIIQFYPIAADETIDLKAADYSLINFHFINGTKSYRVNPEASFDNDDIERNIVNYDVDGDRNEE